MSEEVATETEQDDEKRILGLAYEGQIQAITSHSDLAFKVFSWSTTLMLAIVGYVLSQSAHLDTSDRALLTIVIVVLSSMTFWWQRQNYLETVEHGQSLERLHEIFKLTKSGHFGIKEAVFTGKWHAAKNASRARFGISSYNVVLLAMTVVVLLVLWKT